MAVSVEWRRAPARVSTPTLASKLSSLVEMYLAQKRVVVAVPVVVLGETAKEDGLVEEVQGQTLDPFWGCQ